MRKETKKGSKKGAIALAMAAALTVTAFAAIATFGTNVTPVNPINKEQQKEPEKPTPVVPVEEHEDGGTVVTENVKANLPEDLQNVFNNAAAQYNVPQQAVAYLGSQVVSGTNHAFLTQNTDGSNAFHVMIAYQDLDGNVELKSVPDIDHTAESSSSSSDSGEAGGWTVAENTYSSLPSDAKAALDNAMAKSTGSSVTPVALLGTQVVNGTNYTILCKSAPVSPDASESLQVVHVTQDASGNAEITEFIPFAL